MTVDEVRVCIRDIDDGELVKRGQQWERLRQHDGNNDMVGEDDVDRRQGGCGRWW
jgi:hypothetical protein